MYKKWVLSGSRGDDSFMFRKEVTCDTVLGRSKTSLVPLATRYAGRSHMKIWIENEEKRPFLEDLGSLNGTYLNGRKMVPRVKVPINDKDMVRIGLETDPTNCFCITFHSEATEGEVKINKENNCKGVSATGCGRRATVSSTRSSSCDSVIVLDDDDKVHQDAVVVLDTIPAADAKRLMHASQKIHPKSHSDSQFLTNGQTRSSSLKPSVTSGVDNMMRKLSTTSGNGNNKRKRPDSAKELSNEEKRLKAANILKKEKTTSTVTSESQMAGPSDTRKSVKPKCDTIRDPLASITPSRKVDVVASILGPSVEPSLDRYLQNQRKAAAVKKKPILIDAAPLQGQKKGYTTAGERLPERPVSPKRGSNKSPPPPPIDEEVDDFPVTQRRIAHPGAATRAAVQTAASSAAGSDRNLLLKTPVAVALAEAAARPAHQQRLLPSRPKIIVDPYLHDILTWNINWFKEADAINEEPILTKLPLLPLLTSYKCYEDYADTHIPYVLHEIWANLIEAYRKNSNSHLAQSESFAAHVTGYEMLDHFVRIFLEWPVKEGVRCPMEGDMIMLDITTEDYYPDSRNIIKIIGLGFIADDRCDTRFSISEKKYYVHPNCKKIQRLTVLIKKQMLKIDQKKPVMVLRLDYVKPHLKHIEAILSLKYSKLLDDILKPRILTCQIPFPRDDNLGNKEFNKSQHEAILGSAEGVKRGRALCKILMIQGPPGTGKTHTLIGIVKEIYNSWHPWNSHLLPKILVCAPSNGAVDEIGKRLYRERRFLNAKEAGRSLRCVRMGVDESVKSECQHMTLDHLVATNMKQEDPRLKEIEKDLEALDISLSTARYNNEFVKAQEIEGNIERKTREMERLEKTKACAGNPEQQKNEMRNDILKKADIILTTLNSCRTSYLDKMFNQNQQSQFDCVIIDEASQCSEPELLMPLCYQSITKVILIGDPMQLPATVKSQKAQAAGYGTSLFERFFKFFGNYDDRSPVHTLNTQFRMHYEICKFPSAKFYDSRLLTAEGAGCDLRFPIKPYTVFDIKGTTHSSEDPKNIYNVNEATFIVKLCTLLNRVLLPEKTVGIITPYQGQKRMIKDRLQNARIFTVKIDVNTIDGFQGQERDVIIFSSVRSSEGLNGGVGFLGSAQRMNVALTRAKFALIVCLCRKSLSASAIWKDLIDDANQRGHLKEIGSNATTDAIQPFILQPDAQMLRS